MVGSGLGGGRQRQVMGMERDFAVGNGHLTQCADGMLLSCTIETCIILQTNITPINSVKNAGISSPFSSLQNQELCFNRLPMLFVYTLKLEKLF